MSPSPSDPARIYEERRDRNRELLRRLDRRGLLLANARLVFFLFALAAAGLTWAQKLPSAGWWLALALGCVFVGLAIGHDRVLGRERRARHRVWINERGLARLGHRFEALPVADGQLAPADHAYASDLDLFGPSSLFQLVDATTDRLGEQRLAGWLGAPADPSEVALRQAAVRELAPRVELREELETEGRMLAEQKPDPSRLLAWAESRSELDSPLWRWAPRVLPPVTLALWLAGKLAWLPPRLWLASLAVQIALVLVSRRAVARLFDSLAGPGERMLRFEHLFGVLERADFEAPLLTRLSAGLRASGATPSIELRRLGRALSFLQLREQPLFHIPLNLLLLWDLNWTGSLERWRQRCGARVRGWIEALGDVEALSSLAGFAFDNPDYAWPELSASGPRFVAEGLGHPLISADRRVSNDVALPEPGCALLVTGSNMSGKTTLLRTLGINAVLALAGAPVCARRLEISLLHVRSSMRVRDSLAQGLSFFYAELQRLKSVLDACEDRPVMFLLDEVLQGTNTAERHLASRAIIRRMVERGAIGAIATHDLGLTTLHEETASKVRNVHFTDQIIDGEMSFDFRLREGVVATTNAIALLKRVGIDVEIPSPAASVTGPS